MLKKAGLALFLSVFALTLSAAGPKPVLGQLVEREDGRLYDTFYYHMNLGPQFLLQLYDQIAIPHSVNLKMLDAVEFNGVKIADMLGEVTYDQDNYRAFRIALDKSDRANWMQVRNLLAAKNVAAWPVLTYYAPDHLIVLDGTMRIHFYESTPVEEQHRIMDMFNLKVVEVVDDNFYSVELPVGVDPFAFANMLYERGLVHWAQPNWPWYYNERKVTPNDPYFSNQWHLTQINSPSAWDTETGEGRDDVRIAIIDSGVDLTHPDLNVLTSAGIDLVGNTGGAPLTSQDDHESVPHGTACAGLAAAKTNNGIGVAGSCWGCPIIPIRFLSTYQSGDTYKAIKHAVDNGAWVVNNSWGCQDSNGYGGCTTCPADNSSSQGITYGISNGRGGKGTIFLWAAGNSHCPTSNQQFLHDNNMLTVSALESNGSMASYSNYGAEVDISAGAGAATTDIQGNQYGYACNSYNCLGSLDSNGDYTSGFSGTSAATPVAAGAVALMLAGAPDLSFSGAMNCVKSSAFKTTKNCAEGGWTTQSDEWLASGSAEHSPCFGFGVIDANAMLVGAKNGTCGACISTAKIDGCYDEYNGKDDDCSGTVDDDCTNGGNGRAGSACSEADDCINTAVNPVCLTGEGWNGGYCSASCSKNSDCYNGTSKVECYEGHCIAKCSFNTVREGYACISNKILPSGTVATANCGNGVKEEGEVCDGGTKTCHSIDSSFTDGYAMCRDDCRGYDTSTCSGGGGSLCGNKNLDTGEICDSETIPCKQLAGAPEGGTAKCASDCLSWDRSGCYDTGNGGGGNGGGSEGGNGSSGGDHANCGNGYIDAGEQCDDGNRMDGDGCSQYCMFENDKSSTKKKSSGCSALIL